MLAVKYFSHGQTYPAVFTLMLIVIPAIIMQVFSMRWHIVDETASCWHWVTHIFLQGIIHRYISALKTGFKARSSSDPRDVQRLHEQLSDISLLHLFESFMESAPQLVLQLTIMVNRESWPPLKCVSAVTSLLSLASAVAEYTKAMNRAQPDKTHVSRSGLVCQVTWCGGMISARIATLVLFAVGFHAWVFLLYGVHLLVMTPLICFKMADVGKTVWERFLYCWVLGSMYFFCFFNMQEGRSRQRALAFYLIIISQNLVCLILFVSLVGITRSAFVEVTLAFIVGGQVLGLTSLLLYYHFFQPAGPITLGSRQQQHSTECSSSPYLLGLNIEQTAKLRSLKHLWRTNKHGCLTRLDGTSPQERCLRSGEAFTD